MTVARAPASRYLDEVRERPGPVLAFAHRGGAYHPELEGLENTLAAFRHAVALGYTYLETDVHVDRATVCCWPSTTPSWTGSPTAGARSATLTSPRCARPGSAAREQVPTLAELFDAFPRRAVQHRPQVRGRRWRALADFLAGPRRVDRVLVGSFSPARLREFRRLTGGRVATSATPPEVAAFRVLPAAGWPPADPRRVAALQVPHRRGPLLVVPPALIVRRAHAAGKHVHVWTVDDPDEMPELLDLGVDGLITDRTDLLRDVLVERGQWRGPLSGSTGPGRRPASRASGAREQRAWYWYDWANSAFYTTVLGGPVRAVPDHGRGRAAGCGDRDDDTCSQTVNVLGPAPGRRVAAVLPRPASPPSLSAFVLPVVGAMVDRSARKKRHLAGFAWAGSSCAALLFFVRGDALAGRGGRGGRWPASWAAARWWATTRSWSTSPPRTSATGCPRGAGPSATSAAGSLLALNLAGPRATAPRARRELAVRLSLLSAALWWAGFTVIPFLRLRDRAPGPGRGRGRGAEAAASGSLPAPCGSCAASR